MRKIVLKSSWLRLVIPILLLAASALLLLFFRAWFSDRIGPQLIIRGIAEHGQYQQVPTISLEASDLHNALAVFRVKLDYQPLSELIVENSFFRTELDLPTGRLAAGEHRIDFIVTDNSLRKNATRKSFYFTLDNTPPELQWRSRTNNVAPGNVLPVFIRVKQEQSVEITGVFIKQDVTFYPVAHRSDLFRTLLAVNALVKTGTYPLQLQARDAAGNLATKDFPVRVLARTFPAETIVLSPGKAAVLTDSRAVAQNRDRMAEALGLSSREKAWQGVFSRPVEGRVSSVFGMRRVYNNGIFSSYHKGMDLANAQGTPVKAANRGIVVLAEFLPLNGNCVIIDHGQEVFSLYFHMHTILVKPGEAVVRQQQIGTLGTTGISTGPHLHWELQVGGMPVDPVPWESESVEDFLLSEFTGLDGVQPIP